MQIKTPNGILYIDDADERAVKIRQGHAHSFQGEELIVEDVKTGIDLDDVLVKLDAGTAPTKEIQKAVAYLLRKHLESGNI